MSDDLRQALEEADFYRRSEFASPDMNAARDLIVKLADAIAGQMKVPGVMRCAMCEFVLTSISLNMGDGSCTAGENKPEPCPNGCGPLWPMTWEQNYHSLERAAESQVERALKAEARIAELEAEQAKPPQFPTMLRKMWSGGEVQRWINENWNKAP